MSKHSASNTELTDNTLSFIVFWRFIASEIGSSRLKINEKADSIKNLIDDTSDPKEYLKNIIMQSYKRSKCNHLRDTVDLNSILDVLGETAFELQGQQADDLLDIELLEEIAWLLCERYQHALNLPEKDSRNPDDCKQTGSKDNGARVISLSKAKIIKSNLANL